MKTSVMRILDKYIQENEKSQAAFARKAGIPQPKINMAIRGKRSISLDLAKKLDLASGGKISAIDLLGLQEEFNRKVKLGQKNERNRKLSG